MPSRSPSWLRPRTDETGSESRPVSIWWAIAGGVAFAVFMAAPVRDVYAQHFRSWQISTMPSSTDVARFWRAAEPWLVLFVIGSSILSGAVGAVRAGSGHWLSFALRFPTAFGLSLIVEWAAVGVQDGSARDVDLVPTHSLVFLAVAIVVPWLFTAFDWWRLKTSDVD